MPQFLPGAALDCEDITDVYQTLYSRPLEAISELVIVSTSDQPLVLRVNTDGDDYWLPAGMGITIGDLASSFRFQPAVSVKHDGVAPTSGKIKATGTVR